MKKTILIRGGYYSTNIGNAFYIKGAEYLLGKICPEFRIVTASDHPNYFWNGMLGNESSFLDYASYVECEYLVLLGPMLDCDYPKMFRKVYEKLDLNKTKILLLSAGSGLYSQEEEDIVKSFLQEYPHYALCTRDRETYERYHDCFEKSYDGICFALFANEYAPKYKIDIADYIVLNYDFTPEPSFLSNSSVFDVGKIDNSFVPINDLAIIKNKSSNNLVNKIQSHFGMYDGGSDTLNKYKIIRTIHTCMPEASIRNSNKKNVYLSDVATDYLNIYANACCTFTDRLHAAVACLSYGTPVYLQLNSSRCNLLKRLNAEKSLEGLFTMDSDFLTKEKSNMESFLKSLFNV